MIDRVSKGSSPTLLDASKANELIDKVNALSNVQVVRGGNDSFLVSNSNSILQLQDFPEQESVIGGEPINATEHNFYVCINGVVQIKTFLLKKEEVDPSS